MRALRLLVSVSVVVLGCASGGDDDGLASPDYALSAAESTLADSLLDFVNSAPPAKLNAIVTSSAASAIKAARPFSSVSALASTSYVGNAALSALLQHVAPDEVAAGAGFWEETLFAADQAATTLEMANSLELMTFGCDLGLASAGQRIVGARPLLSMDALANVPYVGTSQLRRFKSNVDWFRTGDATASRFDCVAYTAAEIDAALQFVNGAGYGQLCAVNTCGFGAWVGKLPMLLAGRPWTSLETLAETHGIGPASMTYIRNGARHVLGGMSVGPDSVRRVLAHEIWAEWVELGPTVTLEPSVEVGRVYVPGTGYVIRDCRRIADESDPDPQAASALFCTGGCSPITRYWFNAQLGLVFYKGGSCEL